MELKISICALALAVVATSTIQTSATAQQQEEKQIRYRVTLVVFADRRLPDDQWSTLFTAMRRDFADIPLGTQLFPSDVDLVRGDKVMPGIQIDGAITTVYLHGDCDLLPRTGLHVVQGALGWVLRDHGRIAPFVHVDCTLIGEMLGQHALGMNRERRNEVMADAISRVVLHEWVHFATQSSAHKADGISKGSFGMADLMAPRSRPIAHVGHGK